MAFAQCSDQNKKTLEEFYSELRNDKNKFWFDVGTSMLEVIKLLKGTFKETIVFGITSHDRLLLLAKDNYNAPWYVSLRSIGDEFIIEYKMIINKQPWPGAIVEGTTKSLSEFKSFIIIAMFESNGWPDSSELNMLHKEVTAS